MAESDLSDCMTVCGSKQEADSRKAQSSVEKRELEKKVFLSLLGGIRAIIIIVGSFI